MEAELSDDLTALERMAGDGEPAAMAALGQRYLTVAPFQAYRGIELIIAAAEKGNAEAAHLIAVFAATGAGLPQNWPGAFGYLQRAAERGWEPARRQLALLCADDNLPPTTSMANTDENLWEKLHRSIDLKSHLALPQAHVIAKAPRISVLESFLSPARCDWLIERARPKLKPAQIYDQETGIGRTVAQRDNSAMDFNIVETDIVIALIRARIAALTGLALNTMEHTSILHYTAGQQFFRHFDFLDTRNPGYAADVARRGQRVATFLLYLNDDYEGGETDFPAAHWRYRGSKGDGLLFWNVDPFGVPDTLALHSGLPPRSGEKWLLSQWIRGQAQQ